MPSVKLGNALAARSCLIILILTLLRRTFILEQPGSSLLMKTTWMQWLIEVLDEKGIRVFRQPLWMSAFGHNRPKRTLLWSCSPIIGLFRTDKIVKVSKEPAVVKKYLKKDGSTGYTGVGKRLKETEQLAFHHEMFSSLNAVCVCVGLGNSWLPSEIRHYPPGFARLVVKTIDTAAILARDMVDVPQA